MTLEDRRVLLLKLRDALADADGGNDSAEIMIALLDTYNTKETAKEGVPDAEHYVDTANAQHDHRLRRPTGQRSLPSWQET